MRKAIFLDRDGVINRLVFNRKSKEYGAPLSAGDLKIYPGTDKILKKFMRMGYLLFLISNQPDYAKGYTTLKNIKSVQKRLRGYFNAKGIKFSGYFYCFHHPMGIIPGYGRDCLCRKPGTFFLTKAKRRYSLDMKGSWFIGDSDSDTICGKRAGMKTVLIEQERSRHKRGASRPDFFVPGLSGALRVISGLIKER
ncbi:MAG: HAD-IIIA family hydrolase [Candidatus Omnitrophota bacterium]|jgi:D-glycero-D-manno-heptose 1,7-bisphosphate phosphatase